MLIINYKEHIYYSAVNISFHRIRNTARCWNLVHPISVTPAFLSFLNVNSFKSRKKMEAHSTVNSNLLTLLGTEDANKGHFYFLNILKKYRSLSYESFLTSWVHNKDWLIKLLGLFPRLNRHILFYLSLKKVPIYKAENISFSFSFFFFLNSATLMH